MTIILEGADLVGKSTMARILSRELQLPYRGRISKTSDSVGANFRDLILNKGAVLDRCHFITDIVYECLQGSTSPFEQYSELFRKACKMLIRHGIVVVYMTCSREDLRKRYQSRGDSLWSIEDILLAQRHYERIIPRIQEHLRDSVIICDTSIGTLEQQSKRLIKQLKEEEICK